MSIRTDRFVAELVALMIPLVGCRQEAAKPTNRPAVNTSRLVFPGADGALVYKAYTRAGDIIPDFSHCGYGGGGVPIPDVPAKRTLQSDADSKDDTARIQQALTEVGEMPLDASGFRGAVVLAKGTYRIAGSLWLVSSGVVLRGEGDGEDGTVLIATGKQPRALVRVEGSEPAPVSDSTQQITDEYVPVGARSFGVENGRAFQPGDTVKVRRVGNAAWIRALGMDALMRRPDNPRSTIMWKPFDIDFDRVVTSVDGDRVTVDAPIVCAIDRQWGGGAIFKQRDRRIERCGVEQLRIVSEFDSTKTAEQNKKRYLSDEEHATDAVAFDNVKHAWARHVVGVHMVHATTDLRRNAKWITVEDSQCLEPISQITGGRRYSFCIGGELQLVQRCYAKDARHAFIVSGYWLPGLDAFVDCRSENDHADSGPHQQWSPGVLYDNCQGVFKTQDREYMGSGHGWAGANNVYWNCRGEITVETPPTAENFCIGFVGKLAEPSFAQLGHPRGYVESFGRPVEPRSLYEQQVRDRLGASASTR